MFSPVKTLGFNNLPLDIYINYELPAISKIINRAIPLNLCTSGEAGAADKINTIRTF